MNIEGLGDHEIYLGFHPVTSVLGSWHPSEGFLVHANPDKIRL